MLVDTHCHVNMMIKDPFDVALTREQVIAAQTIVNQAQQHGITTIINVGTSLVESRNCIELARTYAPVYASIGIHPNDCTQTWRTDFDELKKLLRNKQEHKIVALGECGLDFHYPDFNKQRQLDAFKAHLECALEYALPVIVHTRQARDETLRALEPYAGELQATIHCFSEDLSFAQQVIAWKLYIGIGAPITYPKNERLRQIVTAVDLSSIVLETDAPFLPPQSLRGKQNHPQHIALIAQFIAQLRGTTHHDVAQQTTRNALTLFGIASSS